MQRAAAATSLSIAIAGDARDDEDIAEFSLELVESSFSHWAQNARKLQLRTLALQYIDFGEVSV